MTLPVEPKWPSPEIASGLELDHWGAEYNVERNDETDDAFRKRILVAFKRQWLMPERNS